MSDDNNIVQFGSVQGGKTGEKQFPSNPYIIVDVDDEEYVYDGYLIFTTHHVCIMEEGPDGDPVTGFLIPMNRVKYVGLASEVEETAH